MRAFPFSIRTSLGIVIVLMGLLGMGLALVTGNLYHRLTLANQQDALAELARLKSEDLLRKLVGHASDLGTTLQHQPVFRRAYAERDLDTLVAQLNDQFHQYLVTTGLVDLRKIQVFTPDFALLAESGAGTREMPAHAPLCPGLLARAGQRQGIERFKILTELCVFQGYPYQAVLVPVGGLRLQGYLSVISDPAPALSVAGHDLGMPIRLTYPNRTPAYCSPAWPDNAADLEHQLFAEYRLPATNGETALHIALLQDIETLTHTLERTRYLVVLIAGLTTASMVFLALFSFRVTTLNPLHALTRQLRKIREDRAHLGETIAVRGNLEIMELAASFNAMSLELHRLHQRLEGLAYSDPLTHLPNRAMFRQCLERCTLPPTGSAGGFALFMMDLDKFKEINDTLGHHAGDELLRQVSLRLKHVVHTAHPQPDRCTLARLGGDEFAALLPVPPASARDDALLLGGKMSEAMRLAFVIDGHMAQVGMSVGIALYPEHSRDAEHLLKYADHAMYRAKRGRLGAVLHGESPSGAVETAV